MAAAGGIAVYGALLATLLAAFQFYQWRNSRQMFAIRLYDEFCEVGKSDVEISISNITPYDIEIINVWFGIRYRPWMKPWATKNLDLMGMHYYNEDGVGNQIYLEKLKSGSMIGAYFKASNYKEVDRGWNWKCGFGKGYCVWIEHSRGVKRVSQVIS